MPLGVDPNCRYAFLAVVHPTVRGHVCTTRDGVPVRDGQDCWSEARAQILEAQR